MSGPALLMCPPDVYDVAYEINVWMSVRNRPDTSLAARQWGALHHALAEELGLDVALVPPMPGAPDMVFAANAGLVWGRRVLLANLRHPQRRVETPAFRAWFEAAGYQVLEPPAGVPFEGEGDALLAGDVVLAGYHQRTAIAAHRWLGETLGLEVLSLELPDPRWYHLDTALLVLRPGLVAWYPGAFDDYARRVIESRFETLAVVETEALRFGCNAVVAGRSVVLPAHCPRLQADLERLGNRTLAVPMTEFIKAGGACKCLVLRLDLGPAATDPVPPPERPTQARNA
ncbi:MAG: amidinotransferase [Armatimonadetes bacterium]|nr:amidinotransferase [Armatimonadota bacterium]